MLSRAARRQFPIFFKEFVVVFLVFCTLCSYQFYKKYEPTIFLTPVDSISNEIYRAHPEAKGKLRTPEILYENSLAVFKVVSRAFKSEADRLLHECKKGHPKISTLLKSLREEEKSTLFGHILVDDASKILYCVPSGLSKSALEKIQHAFARVAQSHSSHGSELKSNNQTIKEDGKTKTLLDFKADEIEYKLDNYFKFMFAEEPISRLLYVYNTKIVKHGQKLVQFKKQNRLAVKQFRKFFTNFLYYVIATGESLTDQDILPLTTLCQPCVVKYNFVGDVENFARDLENGIQHYGKFLNKNESISDDIHALKIQASKLLMHVKHGMDIMRQDISFVENCPPAPVDVIKNVVKKYEQDFILFGYKLEET